jgi:hypothetical protein
VLKEVPWEMLLSLYLLLDGAPPHFRISIITPLVHGLVVVVHNIGHHYLDTILSLWICLMHKTITVRRSGVE